MSEQSHHDSVVQLLDVSKEFWRDKIEIPVLTNTTLHIPTRRFRRRDGALAARASRRCSTCAPGSIGPPRAR